MLFPGIRGVRKKRLRFLSMSVSSDGLECLNRGVNTISVVFLKVCTDGKKEASFD